MSLNLNPLGIAGPTSPAPYVQPDYRVPAVNPNVASYAVGANALSLNLPVAAYAQPGSGNPPAVTWLAGPMGTSRNGPFG
jgi:hypothetical protein